MTTKPETFKLRRGHVLVMRQCGEDLKSRNGSFQYPESGAVAAPDWDPTPNCGAGLHGFLWGAGDGALAAYGPETRWLVIDVKSADVVDLSGKVKFKSGTVVHVGDLKSAAEFVGPFAPAGTPIIGGTATAGDSGTATAGYAGVLIFEWYDCTAGKYRKACTCVDGETILADEPYQFVDGKFVRKD